MHLLLTERLVCPRCGPPQPLVLQVDEWGPERRVREGRLGCANCRQLYPVRAGEADLRFPPGVPPVAVGEGGRGSVEEDAALRLAALLGVAEGPALLLLAGPLADLGEALARCLPDVEVVAVRPVAGGGTAAGVSPLVAGARLPLRDRSVHGIALAPPVAEIWWSEALRVRRPGARIVLDGATPEVVAGLRAAGLAVLLEDDGVVVAA